MAVAWAVFEMGSEVEAVGSIAVMDLTRKHPEADVDRPPVVQTAYPIAVVEYRMGCSRLC